MICLEGTGSFSHVSVRNTAEIFKEPLMFAAISVKGLTNGSKLLEGLSQPGNTLAVLKPQMAGNELLMGSPGFKVLIFKGGFQSGRFYNFYGSIIYHC